MEEDGMAGTSKVAKINQKFKKKKTKLSIKQIKTVAKARIRGIKKAARRH
jgi:hypothetical protein